MMRFVSGLLGLGMSFAVAAAPAEPVRLSFDHLPVIQLVNVVFGDILQENFVVHPDLVNSDRTVTLQLQDKFDKVALHKFIVSFLRGIDIDVQERNGYAYLVPVKKALEEDDNDEQLFYRMKYRSVSYVTDLTSALFKHGRFSTERGVNPQMSAPGKSGGGMNGSKVQETGTNGPSVMDKGDVDAFLFSGSAKEIAMLQKLLPQIDVPVGEVMVKGVVYEVTTTSNEGSAFSLAAAILNQRFGVNIGQTLGAGDSISITTPNFSAILGALNSDNHFKSINNASVRVKSGATGALSVGSDVPVLGSVTVAASGISQQSVTYQPSGVIFNLSPTIRDGSIDLDIQEQISSFVSTTNGVNNSPTLIKREMRTTVASKDDDVIVLGGLDQDNGNKANVGASFLPAFFHSNKADSTKTEVLLVLNVHKI